VGPAPIVRRSTPVSGPRAPAPSMTWSPACWPQPATATGRVVGEEAANGWPRTLSGPAPAAQTARDAMACRWTGRTFSEVIIFSACSSSNPYGQRDGVSRDYPRPRGLAASTCHRSRSPCHGVISPRHLTVKTPSAGNWTSGPGGPAPGGPAPAGLRRGTPRRAGLAAAEGRRTIRGRETCPRVRRRQTLNCHASRPKRSASKARLIPPSVDVRTVGAYRSDNSVRWWCSP